MLERIVSFCLKQRAFIIFLVLLAAGWGVYSFLTIPVDAFPDVTNVQVEIVSTAPALSPLEIERLVTNPVELAMQGLPRLSQMRSVTKYGISVVTLVFEDGVDIYFARQLVFQKLAGVEPGLPEGVEIEMGPVTTAMGEIYQYTLEGPMPAGAEARVRTLTDLRTVQDWVVSPQLKSLPGVVDINSFGGYIKQFQVVVDQDALVRNRLSLSEVFQAIQANNENVGGNFLERNAEQFIVRGVGLFRSVEDIGAVAVKSVGGAPLLLRDIARVSAGQAVRQGAVFKDGRDECVGGVVMMLRGANSREVVERVKAKVAEVNGGNLLPPGVRIKPYYDRSFLVRESIRTVLMAILIGALLIVLVLWVFLRSFRGAFIVILTLPLVALLVFIVMKSVGLGANLMSLGGLAISIGMIIDATVIQVENVHRHLAEKGSGERRLPVVLRSVLEVRKPSIFGELIIAFTFLPILALQGIEGKMFIPLALTVAVALFATLVLSVVVIPVFCALLLRPGSDKESILLRGAKRAYLPALRWLLARRLVIVGLAAAAVVGAAFLLPRLGTEFVPIMDEGAFDMDFQLLPGITLDKALEVNKLVEKRLKDRFPELETVVGKTGQTGIALEARGVDKTGYVGTLRPRSEWKNARTREELFDKMRKAIEPIPGMVFTFSQPIQCRIDELVAGTRAQIIVRLFGPDLNVLNQKADEIAAVLSRVRGATDLAVEKTAGQPYLDIAVDRERLARRGVSAHEVLDFVETAVGGKTATKVYEENRLYDLVVRFPEAQRSSPELLDNLIFRASDGTAIPLAELAKVTLSEGPVQISRENGQRRIGIELNVTGRDIGGFVREAKAEIGRRVRLPSGYSLGWGGQFENQQRAMRRLLVIIPVVVLLIFFFLTVTFGSLKTASLIIINLPLALVGGVLALWITGLYLSVPASIGFIALFGIAVLNGIVLVSYIAQLRQGGLPVREAILKGCEVRFRPVVMTASITVLSLLPLAFATGPGSEIQKPLAVVVIGGILTSTALTLFVLPALYSLMDRKKKGQAF
jgi:cobalt-zinc-cadmium resistance protein CzcA